MSEEETVTTTENVDVEQTPEAAETAENTSVEDAEATTAEETTEAPEVEEKPKVDRTKKKMAKVSYENRELKRQVAQLAKAVEEQSKAVSAAQGKTEPPNIEDYDTMNDYLDARDNYRDTQREAKAKPEARETANTGYDPRDELFDNGQERYDDFEEVVGGDVSISPQMAAAIFEIDDPDLQVDVAYYFGNNHKEASKIARLSERRQIAEVAKIEVKLSNKTPAKKTASKAFKPINPVGGAKTSSSEIQPVEEFESFMKKRNKQLRR